MTQLAQFRKAKLISNMEMKYLGFHELRGGSMIFGYRLMNKNLNSLLLARKINSLLHTKFIIVDTLVTSSC